MSRYDTKEFKELVQLQNTMTHIDIITITGFMDDAHNTLKQHVERYKQIAANK
jgi:hypothetical protein